jgi:hypothetical protein
MAAAGPVTFFGVLFFFVKGAGQSGKKRRNVTPSARGRAVWARRIPRRAFSAQSLAFFPYPRYNALGYL